MIIASQQSGAGDAWKESSRMTGMTADNGLPWAARKGEGLSALEVWLIRL